SRSQETAWAYQARSWWTRSPRCAARGSACWSACLTTRTWFASTGHSWSFSAWQPPPDTLDSVWSPTTAKQGWLISTEAAAAGVGRGRGQILYSHIGGDRANGTGFGGDYGPLPPACAVSHVPGRQLGRSRRIRVGQQQPRIAGRGLVQVVHHRDWKLGQ